MTVPDPIGEPAVEPLAFGKLACDGVDNYAVEELEVGGIFQVYPAQSRQQGIE